MDIRKEVEQALANAARIERTASRKEKTISMDSIPPPPPAKDYPPLRAGTSSSKVASRPTTSGSSAPTRPIPAKPKLRLDTGPTRPLPARPAMVKPQVPLGMNPPTRPGTAASSRLGISDGLGRVMSTKRLSWRSIESNRSRRPIKFGRGKWRGTELVPQPSDDPYDPLNWPMWKKELNLGSLLLVVAMTGVLKTAFISVNTDLAENFAVSYTSAAALTGVPLILSAFTGLVSITLSRIWGKRPVYLASFLLVFIGTVWNTNVGGSLGSCMAARVFQGLGWGAFDTLVMGSIHDTYFEHERNLRIAIYSTVAVATTWGPPLIGGAVSNTRAGFELQFVILSTLFVLAVPAIALGVPETAFDRASTPVQTPATDMSTYAKELPLPPPKMFTKAWALDYVTKMQPVSYWAPVNLETLLQAPRAFIAPTTILLFLVSFLPFVTLWGLTQSLSLLFASIPFMLSPGNVGAILTGVCLFSTLAVATFSLPTDWSTNFSPRRHIISLASGTFLFFIGTLALGLHISSSMSPRTNFLSHDVSIPAVAVLLGLLATGAHTIDTATSRPLIRLSTQFTSANLTTALRATADMDAGAACWRALWAGVFVLVVPRDVWTWDGIRGFCIGASVAQVVLVVMVGCVWWFWDEGVRRADGRVMRLVDLEVLKRSGSFFDTD